MSDLISRNEVMKLVNQFVFGLCKEQNDEVRKTFNKYIEKMPTAYSVDKVVEKLEERTDFLKECTKYGNKNAKQQAESYKTMMMYEVADLIDDLIEIVKQDGVSDDVCEWEKGSSGYVGYPAYYSKCCQTNSKGLEMQTHIIADWKHCPYCGKKIKIVGD